MLLYPAQLSVEKGSIADAPQLEMLRPVAQWPTRGMPPRSTDEARMSAMGREVSFEAYDTNRWG